MTLETITTTASGILASVVAADHFLAKSTTLIHNTVGPFLWALITKQPILAKGVADMGFSLMDIEEKIKQIEEMANRGMAALDKLAQFTGKAAEMVEKFAPAGSDFADEAKAVEDIAAEVSTGIKTIEDELQTTTEVH